MKEKPSYLAAAFNARPLGMPIPPNWFGLAAFGLLGALINPGLWLIGAGVEGLYLWWLSRNERFRNTVDAAAGFTDSTSRYENLLAHLDSSAQSQPVRNRAGGRGNRRSCCSEATRTARRSATCARWPGCT